MPKLFVFLTLAGAISATALAAAERKTYVLPPETAELRPGPGIEAARNNCMACHSVDYIAIQPGRKGKAFWEAEVTKMIKVYHAPIDAADTAAIAAYLEHAY